MIFVLTFGGDPITLESLAPGAADEAIEKVGQWWRAQRTAGRIICGLKLMPPYSATTIRLMEGHCEIVDGTFTAEAQAVGGFGIIDVADLDEALTAARSWPLSGYIEIRPLMSFTGRIFGYRPAAWEYT